MYTIFKLALRNLFEHKSKSIIIALLLVFGIAIVVMGNSFLESVNRGLEKDFRENYTGDVVISVIPGKGEEIDIFGLSTSDVSNPFVTTPALPELDSLMQIVNSEPEVKASTKQISSKVMISKDLEMDYTWLTDNDDLGFDDLPISMLFSGEYPSYFNMFDGLKIIEGSYPEPNTNQVLIDTRVKKSYEKLFKQELNVGDKIAISSAGPVGIIREAEISGIFNPSDENSAMFQIIYSNPDLARAFASLTYADSFAEELPDSVDLSLAAMDEEDMFDDMFDSASDILSSGNQDYNSILGSTELRDQLNKTDDGAWNFIVIKLKNPAKADKIVSSFNKQFKEKGWNVQAMNWNDAAHSYTGTVGGITIIFNLLIFILGVVVFIIIMNTMTVSVLERTGEIGTMRAIGAEKAFIKKLFFTESFILTLASTIVGIILALILMLIFNSLDITVQNSIAKMILGGGRIHFSPTFMIILMTLVVSLLCAFASNLYPVNSALRVSPLKALSKE